jgi:hypothetical protein
MVGHRWRSRSERDDGLGRNRRSRGFPKDKDRRKKDRMIAGATFGTKEPIRNRRQLQEAGMRGE